jgi:hypothetical protein
MAFRRRDLLTRLWLVVAHVLQSHAPDTPPHAAAFYVVQAALLPATCLLPVQTFEWTLVSRALSNVRQVERCRLYYETSALFALEPKDPLIGKAKRVDLASRLACQQGANVAFEIGQLQKKAQLPKGISGHKSKARFPQSLACDLDPKQVLVLALRGIVGSTVRQHAPLRLARFACRRKALASEPAAQPA